VGDTKKRDCSEKEADTRDEEVEEEDDAGCTGEYGGEKYLGGAA